MTKYKTFLHAISIVAEDARKAGRYLEDKRLTQQEKKILHSWLVLRLNKFDEIITSLSTFKCDDPLLESMRLLMLGVAYNNKGVMNLSVENLNLAYELVRESEFHDQKFLAIRNLFHVYLNIKDKSGIKKYFDMLQTCPRHERFNDSFLLCELSYYTHLGDFKMTESIIERAEKKFDQFNEFSKVYFLIMKVDLEAKADHILGCRETLGRLKNHRNFFNSSNFKFIKSIVNNLIDNSPIYVYDRDFDHQENIFWQLKVLASLEASSRAEAKPFWDKLTELSPETYGPDFLYRGDKCLFSICLNKHLQGKDITFEVPERALKVEQLISILTQADGPVRKELIYEMIWGKCIEDKEDLKKLSRLVSLIEKKKGIEIKSIKGCYQLTDHSLKKTRAS